MVNHERSVCENTQRVLQWGRAVSGNMPWRKWILLPLCMSLLTSCLSVPGRHQVETRPERPPEFAVVYPKGTIQGFTEETLEERSTHTISRISLQALIPRTSADIAPAHEETIVVDYFRSTTPNDVVILVFPILGGKNHFADYFAHYYAARGFDSAVVHRDEAFRKPENVTQLESIFRKGVSRDRTVIDFFEKEKQKRQFASFGISRGGINVAITAGVEPRLKTNVIALAGTDLVEMFDKSNVKGVKKYLKKAQEVMKMASRSEILDFLRQTISTDPSLTAQYIEPKDTLMILGIFDGSVPYENGLKLREQLGYPKTIFLPTSHVTSLLYTQQIPLLLPWRGASVFPMDNIEQEALRFYEKRLGRTKFYPRDVVVSLVNFPGQILGGIVGILQSSRPHPENGSDKAAWKR